MIVNCFELMLLLLYNCILKKREYMFLSTVVYAILLVISPLLLFLLIKYVQYRRLCKIVAHIPGYEQFVPPIIQLPHWLYPSVFPKNNRQFLNKFVEEQNKKFGTIWKFCLFDRPLVVISGPQFTKFNSTKHSHYLIKKAKFTDNIIQFTGDSVFTIEDDTIWRRHRQILNPAFSDSSLKNTVFEATNKTMEQFLKQISNGQTVIQRNVVDDFNNITLNVVGLAGFGLALSNFDATKNELAEATNTLLSSFNLLNLLPNVLKKPWFWPLKKVFASKYFFEEQIQQIIQKRQEELNDSETQKDILSILLANSRSNSSSNNEDESWKPLSTEELTANCFIFIVAGFETTSRTLTFALYLLCKFPKMQQKARHIVDQLLLDKTDIDYPMLEHLEYIHWIVLETLRLFVSASITTCNMLTFL